LSTIDSWLHQLSDFGATVGATGNGRESSVPVACFDISSGVGSSLSGRFGNASIAP